jgi:hypothetical protein
MVIFHSYVSLPEGTIYVQTKPLKLINMIAATHTILPIFQDSEGCDLKQLVLGPLRLDTKWPTDLPLWPCDAAATAHAWREIQEIVEDF